MTRRHARATSLIAVENIKFAAAYVRMSTEHQQYSTENQLDVIKLYALENGYEITKIYTDAGKSGLTLRGRKGLQQLFRDVAGSDVGYQIILVYDVSRWGRFQDPDESATYEVRCRQAGVAVEYCAEQFKNDGSAISGILKSVKRMMAGEYSRELSVKVFAGQARLVRLGYRLGGSPGYGYRRQLIDHYGQPKAILANGERKSLQTDRVILVPGPDKEQEVVREIFRLFVEEKLRVSTIVTLLNAKGVPWGHSKPWKYYHVSSILRNERYIGNSLWNKKSTKLKQVCKKNSEGEWVRVEKAFSPLIDDVRFFAAQEILEARSKVLSEDQLVDGLKSILNRHGYLSGVLVRADKSIPSIGVYVSRFGSLRRAFKLAGYDGVRDYSYFEADKRLKDGAAVCIENITSAIRESGASVELIANTQTLIINEELVVSVVIVRYKPSRFLRYQWQVKFDFNAHPDLNLIVRMSPGEVAVKDYLIIPTVMLRGPF